MQSGHASQFHNSNSICEDCLKSIFAICLGIFADMSIYSSQVWFIKNMEKGEICWVMYL